MKASCLRVALLAFAFFPVRAQDLVVSQVEVLVMNPGDGLFAAGRPIYTHSQVRLRPTFRNAGTVSANLGNASWQATGVPINAGTLSGGNTGIGFGNTSLAAGATTIGILPYFGPGQVAAGTYTATVTVDNFNTVAETNEGNNTRSVTIQVQTSSLYSGQADLAFQRVVARADADSACGPNLGHTIDATVVNLGTFPAYLHGNSVITGDAPLTTTYNEGYNVLINPRATKSVSFRASIPRGTTSQLRLETDKWQMVSEANEPNNVYALTVASPALPVNAVDLVITDAFVERTTSNGLYWLVVTIRNNGPGYAVICSSMWRTVNVPNAWAWSSNAPQYATTLAGGQTWMPPRNAKSVLPTGTFQVEIEVNPQRSVTETDYTNNRYMLTVRVPQDVRIR